MNIVSEIVKKNSMDKTKTTRFKQTFESIHTRFKLINRISNSKKIECRMYNKGLSIRSRLLVLQTTRE